MIPRSIFDTSKLVSKNETSDQIAGINATSEDTLDCGKNTGKVVLELDLSADDDDAQEDGVSSQFNSCNAVETRVLKQKELNEASLHCLKGFDETRLHFQERFSALAETMMSAYKETLPILDTIQFGKDVVSGHQLTYFEEMQLAIANEFKFLKKLKKDIQKMLEAQKNVAAKLNNVTERISSDLGLESTKLKFSAVKKRTKSRTNHLSISESAEEPKRLKHNDCMTILKADPSKYFENFKRKPREILVNQASKILVTTTTNEKIKIWNIEKNSSEVFAFLEPEESPECAVWNSNKTKVYIGINGKSNYQRELGCIDFSSCQFQYLSFKEGPHSQQYGKSISALCSIPSVDSHIEYIASSGFDKKIFLWKNGDGIQTFNLQSQHTAEINSIAFCHIRQLLFSGGADGKIFASDLNGKSSWSIPPVTQGKATSRRIQQISIRPNSSSDILASHSSSKDQFRLYDSRTRNCSAVFSIPLASNLTKYIFHDWHPAGNIFVTGDHLSSSIHVFDVRKPDLRQELKVHSAKVHAVKFFDSNNLFSASMDHRLASTPFSFI